MHLLTAVAALEVDADDDADAVVHEAEAVVRDAFVAMRTTAAASGPVESGGPPVTRSDRSDSPRPRRERDRSSVTPWARSPPIPTA